jgi:hypothetical protein
MFVRKSKALGVYMLSKSFVVCQIFLVTSLVAILNFSSQSQARCTYDFNRNGICETVLHTSSITTPRTSSSSITKIQFASGQKHCHPSSIRGCKFTASEAMGSARTGSVNFSITAGAGQITKIEATVGFRATGSYNYTIALGNDITAQPGTTYRYYIEALGRWHRGRYRGEFFEQNGGWTSVGYHSYSSWDARNYNDTRDYWRRIY